MIIFFALLRQKWPEEFNDFGEHSVCFGLVFTIYWKWRVENILWIHIPWIRFRPLRSSSRALHSRNLVRHSNITYGLTNFRNWLLNGWQPLVVACQPSNLNSKISRTFRKLQTSKLNNLKFCIWKKKRDACCYQTLIFERLKTSGNHWSPPEIFGGICSSECNHSNWNKYFSTKHQKNSIIIFSITANENWINFNDNVKKAFQQHFVWEFEHEKAKSKISTTRLQNSSFSKTSISLQMFENIDQIG